MRKRPYPPSLCDPDAARSVDPKYGKGRAEQGDAGGEDDQTPEWPGAEDEAGDLPGPDGGA